VAAPLFPPKQFTLVCALIPAVNDAEGWVMLAEVVVVQPWLSVTVTV
jgi:hypothetical protein